MQELEKILEEVNRRINEYVDHDYVRGSGDVVKGLSIAKSIIRKHLSSENAAEIKRSSRDNDGWISVEEWLPMRTLDEKINESYQKYLVFIDGVDGWDIDIAVYDFWNDKKWREAHDGYGEIENVIAWRPLPEPYRPERSEGE